MSTTLLSVRTEESTVEKLNQIAASMDRNRNWIINEAIRDYLEIHAWQLEEIKTGMADSDAGRTLSGEEMKARILKRHKATKTKAR